jgi:CRP/FNR family nitrogen fixation transcriptional regulator
MRAQQSVASRPCAGSTVAARSAWTANQNLGGSLTTGTVLQATAGREICAEGENTEVFYKVVSGVVRLCKFLPDGRRQIEAFHAAGEMFGLELGEERMLSAEAVTDCQLISYRRRGVEQQAKTDHAISQRLFQYAMQGLSQAQAHSLLLSRRGAAEKVAAFLLEWSTKSAADGVLHLDMSRQDIADYLGLTIESVSRSMSQFEREGAIALAGARHVRITDREALEALTA